MTPDAKGLSTPRQPEGDSPPAADQRAGEAALQSMEADFAPLDGAGTAEIDRRDVDPLQHDSLQAQEAFDSALAVAAAGREEQAIQEFIRASKIAETAREWHLAAASCQRVAEFLASPQRPCDLDRAMRMYRRAVAAYEQCGLFGEARELAYRQMCLRLLRGGELRLTLIQRLELLLYWAIAGFGYRPLRVVGSAAAIVVAFGLLYFAANGVAGSEVGSHVTLAEAIYFSGVTFATVGYGDFVPAAHTRFLALTEGALGILTLGFFVAVVASRLNRS